MKYEDGLKILRFNEKTGKWYKDGKKQGNMTVYLLGNKPCEVCGDKFFYCSGNEGNCCSLKCNALKRNEIYGISDETAKKISKSHMGKVRTLESRKKHSETNKRLGTWSKEKNPSWKGGVDRPNSDIYYSIEYKEWRKKIFERDHFTCFMCDDVGGQLQAHHIKRREQFPELVTDEDNGITLCKDCHTIIRHHEERYEEKFMKYVEEQKLKVNNEPSQV